MRRSTAVWLIIATFLIVVGMIMFGGIMMFNKWDFTQLSTVKYETNTYELTEKFADISVVTDTAEIEFLLSDDGICKVVCYEETKAKHSVSVEDNALSVKVVNTKKWYDYIGIFMGTPKLTVYLPESEYKNLLVKDDTGSVYIPKELMFETIDISTRTGYVKNFASASGAVNIKTSTGAIQVDGVSAGSLDLFVSTGKISVSSVSCEGDVSVRVSTGKTELTDLTCKNLSSKGSTGKMELKNVLSSESISIERSTGDVSFDRCDASELFVVTDTGDIFGSLLSDKVFIVKTDTGRIDVPKTTDGGKCEMTSDTGDIRITIVN